MKVAYDCVLDGYLNEYVYFSEIEFHILRMPRKEEYFFVTVSNDNKGEWEGCDHFVYHMDSAGSIPEKQHYFVGRIERLSTFEKSVFVNRMKLESKYQRYIMINTEDNTNMIYYVKKLDMKTELITLTMKAFWVFLFFVLWIRRFVKNKRGVKDEFFVC